MFKLKDDEEIEVFIPLPVNSLQHTVMLSRLEGLVEQTQHLRGLYFQEEPSFSLNDGDVAEGGTSEIENTVNPEIRNLEHYIQYFQKIESEIDGWRNFSMNRTLYQFDIRQISGQDYYSLKQALQGYGHFFWATPVERFKITDKYFFYANVNESVLIKWRDIRHIEIDLLDEIPNYILATIKKGVIFGKKRLLLCFPQQHLNQPLDILEKKVTIRKHRDGKIMDRLMVLESHRRKQRRKRMRVTKKSEKIKSLEKTDTEEPSEEVKEQEDPKPKKNQENVDNIT